MAITLIKEDGSGLSNANVYADLTDLESLSELLGENISGYTDEQKKAALYVAANKFIDRLHSFRGDPVQLTQSMQCYTDLVTFADASVDIIQSNVEAAILHLNGRLFVNPAEQSAKGEIASETKTLDKLSTSTTYTESTSRTSKYNTLSIDALLRPYTLSGGVKMRNV